MNNRYRQQADERAKQGIPPLPLTPEEVGEIAARLKAGHSTPADGGEDLAALLFDRVPGGVDRAAKAKCDFLREVVEGGAPRSPLTPEAAVEMLGFMQGGYNMAILIDCLSKPALASLAAKALGRCILAGDAVDAVDALRKRGNAAAGQALESWAGAEWFTSAPGLPATMNLVVYRVEGEVNTDDLSPAKQAPTRPDIPLHALSMGETRFPGGRERLLAMRLEAEASGRKPVFVADTLGTGSSRKSAANSLVWYLGRDIPRQPNRREGGVVIAGRIAPIFYNSFEDAGGLPFQGMDVSRLETGMRIALALDPAGRGRLLDEGGKELSAFSFPPALADEYRAGGRINLIIGRKLSARAAALLGRPAPDVFASAPAVRAKPGQGFTLAQKMVGKACGRDGVLPGETCEPVMSTVGSQDTTGPMTRDELNALACLSCSRSATQRPTRPIAIRRCTPPCPPSFRSGAAWRCVPETASSIPG